jgi:hypothetical protein
MLFFSNEHTRQQTSVIGIEMNGYKLFDAIHVPFLRASDRCFCLSG